MSEVGVSVVLCFFSTSIFSVSVVQSVMKDKSTVDDSVMVWLMPHSPSFLKERCCSLEEQRNCQFCLSFSLFSPFQLQSFPPDTYSDVIRSLEKHFDKVFQLELN